MTSLWAWTKSNSHAERPWWTEMRRKRLKETLLLPTAAVGLLLALCVFSQWVSAWPGSDNAAVAAPRLIMPCRQRDLGTAPQGTVLRAAFPIKNAGTRRLILLKELEGCCGQSEAARPIIVAPGDSKDVTVEVDTARWHGSMQHSTHYGTNDPQLPRFTLRVTARVE